MMKKERLNYLLGIGLLGIITLFAVSMYTTDLMNGLGLGTNGVLGIVVLLIAWIQFITWGTDKRAQKDEMGKKIANVSAKISYHTLTISLFLLWVIDRIIFVRKNDFGNISLFAAVCLSMVIFPIVQFISSRKYR
ncbi:hypothetical protein [Priestia megaterium]|uniref:hypothetical protein n=1 Tax=Priestia megaterium TaxID=1404 RepID=UPI00244C3C51|nr:hypothetical protein [Priestia megaterium]MDH2364077.1 hypothetical protein [Priestia megaterium]